jgi:acetate---CoA ligase (ADP-forming) subunit beta
VSTRSEAESKRILAERGIPVLDERTVETPTAAVDAAREVGYPVVVKLCGDGIAHKTERGLVRLALADDSAVAGAASELLAAARPEDGDVALLVAPMVRGARELIVGMHRDPQFGPTVMLGVGGVFAEAIADVAFRLVPLDRVDADEMIDELRSAAILGPFRGEPAVDRDELAGVILGLSALAEDDDTVVAVDVNPLIIVDGRPIAVDALVEVAE